MEHEQSQRVKRTQRDYSFAFKMMVIQEVEKGQLTYKQVQANMVFKEDQQFLSGFVSLDNKIGFQRPCQNHLNVS